ncbi:hypothetical protein CNY89_30095, partial [Amaricoccus sp. HAR-UPW-R2A-40]
DLIRDPRIAVAVTVAAVSYSIMNLVMTATPLAMVGCGFGPDPRSAHRRGGHGRGRLLFDHEPGDDRDAAGH